jgi:hypothetical protein
VTPAALQFIAGAITTPLTAMAVITVVAVVAVVTAVAAVGALCAGIFSNYPHPPPRP